MNNDDRYYYVYMMANERNTVLYTGFTSDLYERVVGHREKLVKGFTSRYNCNKLVYYEVIEGRDNALAREKQIKAGSRQKKVALIESMNPEWKDLCGDIQV